MVSDAKKAAKARYDAKTAYKVSLKLNTNTDADLIELLQSQPHVQGVLKELIRKELKNRGE